MLNITYRVDVRPVSNIVKLVDAGRYIVKLVDAGTTGLDVSAVLSNGPHILNPVAAVEDSNGLVIITPNPAFVALLDAYRGDDIYLSDMAGKAMYTVVINKGGAGNE